MFFGRAVDWTVWFPIARAAKPFNLMAVIVRGFRIRRSPIFVKHCAFLAYPAANNLSAGGAFYMRPLLFSAPNHEARHRIARSNDASAWKVICEIEAIEANR
jgi:hypothetical protein